MALAVVTKASGGLPVVSVAVLPYAMAVTEAANGRGLAVTQMAAGKPGLPVTFVTAAGTPPTSPATILTGLIGWWDASATSSLSLTGSTVNSIADLSGNGKTLARMDPPTPTRNLPTYNATGLNSRPSLMFASASQQIIGCGQFPLGSSDMTAFGVCQMSSTAPNSARIFSYTGGLGTGRDFNDIKGFCLARDGISNGLAYFRNSVTFAAAGMTTGVPHRVILTINSVGVKSIYIDGVLTTTTGTGGAFGINGWFALGSTENTADMAATWEGAIAEAGITTGYIDATKAAELDTYLKNKWGL